MTPPDTLLFAEDNSVDVDEASSSLCGAPVEPCTIPARRGLRARMLDLVSASGMGVLSLFDQGIVSAVNFATMVLIGRAVGAGASAETSAHELGIYQLGFSIILLAACIQNALICTPYAVFYNRLGRDQRAAYAGSALLHQWWLSAFATAVLLLAGVVLSFGLALDGIGPMAWVLAVVMPFILLREFIRRIAFAQLQIRRVLLLDSGVAILQLSTLFVLKQTGNLTATAAFGTIGVACLASAGLVFYSMRSQFAPNRARTIPDLHLNWSFGKWSFAAQVAYLAMVSITSWQLTFMDGTDIAGQFAACSSLVMVANPLLMGFNNFLQPKAIHAFNDRGLAGLSQLTVRALAVTLSASSMLVVLLICFGGWLGVLVYGESVAGDHWVIAVLAMSITLRALGMQVENSLIAMGRPQPILWAFVVGFIVTLVAGFALIWTSGLMGAAIAFVLGNLAAAIIKAAFCVVTFRELHSGAANSNEPQPADVLEPLGSAGS
jgi:O-antigen/teichoic acid export membrane protein